MWKVKVDYPTVNQAIIGLGALAYLYREKADKHTEAGRQQGSEGCLELVANIESVIADLRKALEVAEEESFRPV